VFFSLCKVLFSGFLQFNSNFGDAQNNSKYRDWAPLRYVKGAAHERVVLSGQIIKKCIKGQAF